MASKCVELVVEHEFGHQYWYGMVATNEFEDAWMDEGINSYTEVKVLDSMLGKNTSILNMAGRRWASAKNNAHAYHWRCRIAIPWRRTPMITTTSIPMAESLMARPPACC